SSRPIARPTLGVIGLVVALVWLFAQPVAADTMRPERAGRWGRVPIYAYAAPTTRALRSAWISLAWNEPKASFAGIGAPLEARALPDELAALVAEGGALEGWKVRFTYETGTLDFWRAEPVSPSITSPPFEEAI